MKKKLIRGIKGSISIFLIILMLPFLEIAGALVEANRYHSAVSIMDEIMGSSAYSTLANYDTYLHKRFGVLATSQEKDIGTLYEDYIMNNASAMPNSMELTDISLILDGEVMKDFTLANEAVLKEQIINYAKVSGLTKLATDFVDLDSLLSSFDGLKNFESIVSCITSSVDFVSEAVDVIKSIVELKKYAKEVREKDVSYDDGFNSFNNAAKAYHVAKTEYNAAKKELNTARNNVRTEYADYNDAIEIKNETQRLIDEMEKDPEKQDEEYQELIDKRDEEEKICQKELKEYTKANNRETAAENKCTEKQNALNKAASTLNNKKTSYKTTVTDLSTAFADYSSALTAVKEAANDLKNQTVDSATNIYGTVIDSEINKKDEENEPIKNEVAAFETKYKDADYENNKNIPSDTEIKKYTENLKKINELQSYEAGKKFEKSITKAVADGAEAMDNEVSGFTKILIALVDKHVKDLNDIESKNLDTFNMDTEVSSDGVIIVKRDKTVYHIITDGMVEKCASDAVVAAYVIKVQNEMINSSFMDMVKSLKATIESLINTQLFVNPDLCAEVDKNLLGPYGMSVKDTGSQNAMCGLFQTLLQPMVDLLDCLCNWNDKNFFEKIDLLSSSVTGIGDFFAQLVEVIKQLIENIKKFGDSALVATYLTYMLPCRTDYSGANMNAMMSFAGIPYDETGFAGDCPISGGALAQILSSLVSYNSGGSGTNKMFMGAELEYVMGGTNSETYNQILVFGSLYMLRLIMDIVPILTNAEVSNMAATAGSATFGIGSVVIYLMLVVLEPFIDTYILVNKGDVGIFKTKIFLTPTGIPELLKSVSSLLSFTPEKKSIIKENAGNFASNSNGKKGSSEDGKDYEMSGTGGGGSQSGIKKHLKGILDLDYKQHLFLLMLLNGNLDGEMKLLKNLIQMEGMAKYNTEESKNFDIRHTYTFVEAEATVQLKPFFPSLMDYALLKRTRKVVRGY